VEHHRYGIKHTEKTLILMRSNHPKTKIVYQYLADKTTLVAKYNSLREMTEQTGITRDYVVRSIKKKPRQGRGFSEVLCTSSNQLVHNKWFFICTSSR
jgi:hypothetical protein